MSARAVGAYLLRQMEYEEFLVKYTPDVFGRRFADLIAEEVQKISMHDAWLEFARRRIFYETRDRLWKNDWEKERDKIEARWRQRLKEWGDWYEERAGGSLHHLVLHLEKQIKRGLCGCVILQAHNEAIREDILYDLRLEVAA